jgi:hypothetical protein
MNSAGNSTHCPCCGRSIRRSRPGAGPAIPVDTNRLSDTDVFRHYKRTAPVEDLRFFLRHVRLSPDLRADGESLLADGCRDTGGMLSRSEWYRRLTALQDRWRRDTAAEPLPEVSALAEAV